jgi:multiple sugar transport system substrate-binding protein
MLATSTAFHERVRRDVSIEWTPRSLKEFGMMSVEELARQFDFIVMDHPHIGTMARSGSVLALDEIVDPDFLRSLAEGSPGHSHESYRLDGHQWALAIDAACQTSVSRPDLLAAAPRTWRDVVELARSGRVLWPLCGVDAAASLMTMAASAGSPCASAPGHFVDREVGRWAMVTMREVAQSSDERCLVDNPINVLEAMSQGDDWIYSPLAFCYVNYSSQHHSGRALSYGAIPRRHDEATLRGALLGGAGLAISAHTKNVEAALEYARYVASPDVQRGDYVRSGGQPAHARAWSDPGADDFAGGFFSAVLPTLENSWTRPNGPRFAEFQNRMIDHFENWYESAVDLEAFLDVLDEMYVELAPESGSASEPES